MHGEWMMNFLLNRFFGIPDGEHFGLTDGFEDRAGIAVASSQISFRAGVFA